MRVLEPLAALLLSRQVPYAQAEEWLRSAYVRSCARAYVAQGKEATVSALSVATGLQRREVKRLLESPAASSPPVATMVPAIVSVLWRTDPRFLDDQGEPRPLQRTTSPGEAGFDELAQAASKDIHPRTVLEELLRLGSVLVDGDRVMLLRKPASNEAARQANWAVGSANLGDHLSAALMNLLSDPPPMFERAIFADGLTFRSAQRSTEFARELWEPALPRLREKLQALVDLDADSPEAQEAGWRMRIGLFSYMAPMNPPAPPVQQKTYRPRKKRAASPKE